MNKKHCLSKSITVIEGKEFVNLDTTSPCPIEAKARRMIELIKADAKYIKLCPDILDAAKNLEDALGRE